MLQALRRREAARTEQPAAGLQGAVGPHDAADASAVPQRGAAGARLPASHPATHLAELASLVGVAGAHAAVGGVLAALVAHKAKALGHLAAAAARLGAAAAGGGGLPAGGRGLAAACGAGATCKRTSQPLTSCTPMCGAAGRGGKTGRALAAEERACSRPCCCSVSEHCAEQLLGGSRQALPRRTGSGAAAGARLGAALAELGKGVGIGAGSRLSLQ